MSLVAPYVAKSSAIAPLAQYAFAASLLPAAIRAAVASMSLVAPYAAQNEPRRGFRFNILKGSFLRQKLHEYKLILYKK